MKEQADQVAAQSPPAEPKKTQDQEDTEFEKALQDYTKETAPAKEPEQNKGTPPSFIRSWKSNTSFSMHSGSVKPGMTDTEVTHILGSPKTLESYTLNQDVYEVWFYEDPKKPFVFKNGVLVSTKMDYYQNIKQTATPNRMDSYDKEADRMQEDESEQNFDYW